MFEVLAVTIPIFLIIGIGYALVRWNIVPKSAIPGMGVYVIYCALPALLFKALATRDILEILNPYYLGAFGIGSWVVLFLSFGVARWLRGKSMQAAAFQGLGGSMANSGFIGYALVVQLFDASAVLGVALSMLVDLVLLVPTTIALAESAAHDGAQTRKALLAALKKTLTNPLLIAIVLGILASLAQWQPPDPVMQCIEILAASAASVALFVIGGTLVGLSIRGQILDITQMSLFKLAVQPLAVALVVWLLPPFDPALQATAILLASMPMAGVFPLIGQPYGQEGICATTLVTATVLSFISINVVIWLLSANGMLLAR